MRSTLFSLALMLLLALSRLSASELREQEALVVPWEPPNWLTEVPVFGLPPLPDNLFDIVYERPEKPTIELPLLEAVSAQGITQRAIPAYRNPEYG